MSRKPPTFTVLMDRYRTHLEHLATSPREDGGTDVSPQARAMLVLDCGQTCASAANATGLTACRVEHFRRRFICLGPPGLVDAPALKRRPVPRFADHVRLHAA